MKPIVKDPLIALADARRAKLEELIVVNEQLTRFIMSTLDIEDASMQREVLLRTVAQLSHQSNIVVGLAVIAGVHEHEVERAVAVGSKTAKNNLDRAREANEKAMKEPH